MNSTAKKILHTFEALPSPEQTELAAAILRLTLRDNLNTAMDDDLMIHAEELALAQKIELNSIE